MLRRANSESRQLLGEKSTVKDAGSIPSVPVALNMLCASARYSIKPIFSHTSIMSVRESSAPACVKSPCSSPLVSPLFWPPVVLTPSPPREDKALVFWSGSWSLFKEPAPNTKVDCETGASKTRSLVVGTNGGTTAAAASPEMWLLLLPCKQQMGLSQYTTMYPFSNSDF